MRFSLQDIKKTVHRRGGELSVSLHFLRKGELRDEIGQLIAYYESLLGQPQRMFSFDDARACIGDYRLAYCLNAVLSNWYIWRQRDWTEVIQGLNGQHGKPDLTGIASPVQLRLALYSYVNEQYQGFLDAQTRIRALQSFAEVHSLDVHDLEYLLVIDSEEEARLVRGMPEAPTAQEVATLYNQWAFESALFNASSVRFVIDCNAFGNTSLATEVQAVRPTPGVGAVIKRLCFLARKMGVYYDLAYEPILAGMPILLSLTLYGPQEVTGAPQQYGLRLARLCRLLMGYGVAKTETGRKTKRPSFANAIVEASATVHFLQRSYAFTMDADLLQLLPSSGSAQEASENGAGSTPSEHAETARVFDSSIEQYFAEAFTALANSRGVDGWRLEREPEPLLLDQSIFIPDFALTRAQHRIYIEILGFWTSSYRERKLQKLQQLQGRSDLLLAIPMEAKDAFASIAADFPIVVYDGQLSATEVVSVLRNRYDDFAQRLARIDVVAVRNRVRQDGLLSERVCAEILHCYRRSEIQRSAERVTGENIVFVTGIGLYSIEWMEQVRRSFIQWMSDKHSVILADVIQEIKGYGDALKECEDATIETIVGMWSEVEVLRNSIFDVMVEVVSDTMGEDEQSEKVPGILQEKEMRPRERRTTIRKRSTNEPAQTTQENLWG